MVLYVMKYTTNYTNKLNVVFKLYFSHSPFVLFDKLNSSLNKYLICIDIIALDLKVDYKCNITYYIVIIICW